MAHHIHRWIVGIVVSGTVMADVLGVMGSPSAAVWDHDQLGPTPLALVHD